MIPKVLLLLIKSWLYWISLFKFLLHAKHCARCHSRFREGYGMVESLRESHSLCPWRRYTSVYTGEFRVWGEECHIQLSDLERFHRSSGYWWANRLDMVEKTCRFRKQLGELYSTPSYIAHLLYMRQCYPLMNQKWVRQGPCLGGVQSYRRGRCK